MLLIRSKWRIETMWNEPNVYKMHPCPMYIHLFVSGSCVPKSHNASIISISVELAS